jgi:hypothetical protein
MFISTAGFDNEHSLCVFEQKNENNFHFLPANSYGPIIDNRGITIVTFNRYLCSGIILSPR